VAPETTHFLHPDHLGSPRLITDETGNNLAQHVYFPFGEEATPPATDEVLKFTGHERDPLGAGTTDDLDYMHARYFSAHLGRFMSVDPVGADSSLPQSWNRYSYVLGNPVKLVDPRGLQAAYIIDGINVVDERFLFATSFVEFTYFGSFLRSLSLFGSVGVNALRPRGQRGGRSADPCTGSSNVFFDTLEGVIEDLGPVTVTGSFPLWPIPGGAGIGISVSATARPDGSSDLFIGLGGIVGSSARASAPGAGATLFGGSTGGERPSGFGLRAAGALGVGNPLGVPVGVRGGGFISQGGRGASAGVGVVGGASGSLTFGRFFSLTDPQEDPCP
jgi:RHS repeat-associated protein